MLDALIAAEVTLFQGHFIDRMNKPIFKNREFIVVFLIQFKCFRIFTSMAPNVFYGKKIWNRLIQVWAYLLYSAVSK